MSTTSLVRLRCYWLLMGIEQSLARILQETADLSMLATSKSGTLLLRRDQGEMAVFWDSRSRRL